MKSRLTLATLIIATAGATAAFAGENDQTLENYVANQSKVATVQTQTRESTIRGEADSWLDMQQARYAFKSGSVTRTDMASKVERMIVNARDVQRREASYYGSGA